MDNVLRQILILTGNFRARLWASMYNFIVSADLTAALQAKYCPRPVERMWQQGKGAEFYGDRLKILLLSTATEAAPVSSKPNENFDIFLIIVAENEGERGDFD